MPYPEGCLRAVNVKSKLNQTKPNLKKDNPDLRDYTHCPEFCFLTSYCLLDNIRNSEVIGVY